MKGSMKIRPMHAAAAAVVCMLCAAALVFAPAVSARPKDDGADALAATSTPTSDTPYTLPSSEPTDMETPNTPNEGTTDTPTPTPSLEPTEPPTTAPTDEPTDKPTDTPTEQPTKPAPKPSDKPQTKPSKKPKPPSKPLPPDGREPSRKDDSGKAEKKKPVQRRAVTTPDTGNGGQAWVPSSPGPAERDAEQHQQGALADPVPTPEAKSDLGEAEPTHPAAQSRGRTGDYADEDARSSSLLWGGLVILIGLIVIFAAWRFLRRAHKDD